MVLTKQEAIDRQKQQWIEIEKPRRKTDPEHAAKIKERDRLYRIEHREEARQRSREWRAKHPGAWKYQHARYPEKYKAANKRHRDKIKLEVLTHYGGNPPKCDCCGEALISFLTISHVNNDGYKHRQQAKGQGTLFYKFLKRNNFPNDPVLKVECYNCNCGARVNNGVCPHKQ